MNIRSLQNGLEYCGSVDGKRQTYYVFKSTGDVFVLFSFATKKKNAGNFNLVDGTAVQQVLKKFAGSQSLTTSDVVKKLHKPQYVQSTLEALNILYVMVAIGSATIDARYTKAKKLYFNVKH